jgi:hypothetical protein
MKKILFLLVCSLSWPVFSQEDRGAMVTAIEGKVERIKGGTRTPLEAFERVEAGELLALDKARLTLVFFLTGRQETWQGSGRLELEPGEGKGFGLAAPETKALAPFLVKQISRTPTLLAQGRAGATRLRAMATPEAIAKVEESYKRLRMEAAANDLNPEMYRLSALFEMKAYDEVEIALRELESSRPDYGEATLLVALYRKALRNTRQAQ